MSPACLEDRGPQGVRLRIKVVARAARTEVVGRQGSALKVRVAAAPVDDAANKALRDFLADRLGLPRAAVRLIQGRTHPQKVLTVVGITAAEAARRLGLKG